MRRAVLAATAALVALGSCRAPRELRMPALGSAQVASDFDTYALRRVGLMPFLGDGLSPEQSHALQLALYSEISRSTPYEVLLLEPRDLDEVEESQPYRRGWYSPRTIIELSKRYRLDGVLFGTVTQQRFYPPQILSLQADLVAAETGLVIWSASVHLDAADDRVIEGLHVFYGREEDENEAAPGWELSLLSPERFARFAAFQLATLL